MVMAPELRLLQLADTPQEVRELVAKADELDIEPVHERAARAVTRRTLQKAPASARR
jgi:hypothetical protein